jgi:sugar-specific transcriptional regulator TrmB
MQSLLQLGLKERDALIYETLIDIGPLSVRKLASETGLNRGSVYEAIKELRKRGLVSHYQKRQRQYFVAEDPARIELLLDDEQQRLEKTHKMLMEELPRLRTRFDRSGGTPVARSYEGDQGVRDILDDLLTTLGNAKEKQYHAYSSSSIKKYLYRSFPQFTERRIAAGIRAQVISIGSGGRLVGLDERRWLSERGNAPTYTLIYADRVAHIALQRGEPHGTVITDTAIADTQRTVFGAVWEHLPDR